MMYWILVVTYLVGTDIAVLNSYEECTYVAAIITNDHAYIPNTSFIKATCIPLETVRG